MNREFRLTDKFDRDLGYVSKTWSLGGDLGARFEPGPDYDSVRDLFQRYELNVSGESNAESNLSIYDDLVSLQPRLVAISGESDTEFHVAIVSRGPSGYTITLVRKAA